MASEVTLDTWERFAEADPLTPRAVEQMLLGVSTRKYVRSIEPAPPGLKIARHEQERGESPFRCGDAREASGDDEPRPRRT